MGQVLFLFLQEAYKEASGIDFSSWVEANFDLS
jgi:hypothetical protein